ncbi:hypothetical protein HU200_067575 [Digitaria exilis]|uniref:RING-type domain-containing protein n=1 Tax=Digitaria exilis TaxID=1010633 RepID=A0A834ZVA7_9POAL|nr:hypothetical protein HU200_067575 [Digitaria exilis]CAB3489120.1 unnamed protein product [Digitaria exilis]
MEEAPPEIGQLQAQGAESPSPPPASGSSPTHATAAAGFWLTGNKRGRAPASSEAIQGLREVAAPTDGSSDCCAICLQDVSTDAKLRAMPCSHAFHQDCIFQWLRRSAACPLCRRQLPTEEEAEEEQVPMSRRVRYDEDGQPYMRLSGDDLLEEEELDEEEQQERAEGIARWQTMMEQHLQWMRSRQSST